MRKKKGKTQKMDVASCIVSTSLMVIEVGVYFLKDG